MKYKLRTKINALFITIIIVMGIAVSSATYLQVKGLMFDNYTEDLEKVAHLTLDDFTKDFSGEWRIKDGKLYKGNALIEEQGDSIDNLGALSNSAITIFQDKTSVMTNVLQDNKRIIGTDASEAVQKAVLQNNENFVGPADVAGVNYLTMYMPLQDASGKTIGMWFVGVDTADVNSKVFAMLLKNILITLGIMAVGLVIIVLFTNAITRPLSRMSEQLESIAEGEGDLTQTLDVHTKDEIGDVATAFNHMLDTLRTMMLDIAKTAEQVVTASSQLTASSAQTAAATGQVAHSMEDVTDATNTIASRIENSVSALQEMADGVQQMAEAASAVSDDTEVTRRYSNQSFNSLKQVMSQMTFINEASKKAEDTIIHLGDQSEEVGNIVSVITDIADQTNLLALNASIEAARAGENGKGFAVVADEVRKLAEQSQSSAEQITKLIENIQQNTGEAVEAIKMNTTETLNGIAIVKETQQSFTTINNAVEDVSQKMHEVSAVTEELSAGIEEVTASAEIILDMTHEEISSTHEVSAATEEQLASMQEIDLSAERMTEMAQDLQKLIQRFKY